MSVSKLLVLPLNFCATCLQQFNTNSIDLQKWQRNAKLSFQDALNAYFKKKSPLWFVRNENVLKF